MSSNTIDSFLNIPGGRMPPEETNIPSNTVDQEGFLRLLVAQIQNQDPLEPLSNEEFVSQLTAFSSLDELREIKEGMGGLGKLEDIAQLMSANLALQQASVNAAAVSLIGNEVEAVTNTVVVGTEDSAGSEIGFTLPDSSTASVTVTLRSPSGNVLYSVRFNPTNPPDGVRVEGNRVFIEIPSEDAGGNPLPRGPAEIEVRAETASGTMDLATTLLGAVGGLDFSGETTRITVGGTPVDLVNVIAVNRLQVS